MGGNSGRWRGGLRQGEGAMADVWKTKSWVNRHFSEMLGFTEVNIYKTLTYFLNDKWGKTSHNDFRRRLAFAFLTLGKYVFPDDIVTAVGSSASAAMRCGHHHWWAQLRLCMLGHRSTISPPSVHMLGRSTHVDTVGTGPQSFAPLAKPMGMASLRCAVYVRSPVKEQRLH